MATHFWNLKNLYSSTDSDDRYFIVLSLYLDEAATATAAFSHDLNLELYRKQNPPSSSMISEVYNGSYHAFWPLNGDILQSTRRDITIGSRERRCRRCQASQWRPAIHSDKSFSELKGEACGRCSFSLLFRKIQIAPSADALLQHFKSKCGFLKECRYRPQQLQTKQAKHGLYNLERTRGRRCLFSST